jgi:hypothetical protein
MYWPARWAVQAGTGPSRRTRGAGAQASAAAAAADAAAERARAGGRRWAIADLHWQDSSSHLDRSVGTLRLMSTLSDSLEGL